MDEAQMRKLLEKVDWRSFTPEDSPLTPLDALDDPRHRDLSAPDLAAGEVAHDFALPLYDFSEGRERATGETFRLLEVAAERPVALIFGSYT